MQDPGSSQQRNCAERGRLIFTSDRGNTRAVRVGFLSDPWREYEMCGGDGMDRAIDGMGLVRLTYVLRVYRDWNVFVTIISSNRISNALLIPLM